MSLSWSYTSLMGVVVATCDAALALVVGVGALVCAKAWAKPWPPLLPEDGCCCASSPPVALCENCATKSLMLCSVTLPPSKDSASGVLADVLRDVPIDAPLPDVAMACNEATGAVTGAAMVI